MEQQFNTLVNELESRLTKLGVYLLTANIGIVSNEKSITIDELSMDNIQECELYMTAMFEISDIAWSDRVLNPDVFLEKKEFQAIAPTEFEISLESFKDEILNWDEEE